MDLRPDPAFGALADARAARVEAVGTEPPYVLIEPFRRTTPLIFTSPHSGRRYPKELMTAARVGLASLRRSEDAYVDEIFAGAAAHGAPILCASVARAYVDLNRDPTELDPAMFMDHPGVHTTTPRVQAGLGAIPRIAGDGQEIYWRKLPAGEAERRMSAVHVPYHDVLRGLVEDTKAAFGCAIVIDCHSMPSSARGPQQPDIVLGDRFGASCHPSITAMVEATLRRFGYRVSRNTPFAGGHTTQTYGRPLKKSHALQIELNRSLYLDERTLERSSGFKRVHSDMARLAAVLAEAELHRSLA